MILMPITKTKTITMTAVCKHLGSVVVRYFRARSIFTWLLLMTMDNYDNVGDDVDKKTPTILATAVCAHLGNVVGQPTSEVLQSPVHSHLTVVELDDNGQP